MCQISIISVCIPDLDLMHQKDYEFFRCNQSKINFDFDMNAKNRERFIEFPMC